MNNSSVKPAETAERSRLQEARDQGNPLEALGAISQRTPVGNRPGGLQREWRRLELLHPRPGPLARLSLGRGRHRRHQRRESAPVLCPGSVERQGSDPQGAPVRTDEQRGQSRGGCEGVLLLSRQHADPFIHEVSLQISASGISVSRSDRDEPRGAVAPTWNTSCSIPAYSMKIAISTSSWNTPRQSPTDILIQISLCNRGPGCGAGSRAADALVPQYLDMVAGRAEAFA